MSLRVGWRIPLWLILIGLLVALAALVTARNWHPAPRGGLHADFKSAGASLHAGPLSVPSTASISRVIGTSGNALTAEWTGFLWIDRGGDYLFRVTADDGAHLFVDGQPVVDNGGSHGAVTSEGRTTLARGEHAITVQYQQISGPFELDISHVRYGDGRVVHWEEEQWLLRDRPLDAGERLRVQLFHWAPGALIAMALAGLLLGYAGVGILLSSIARASLGVPRAGWLERAGLALGTAWFAIGIHWGLPNPRLGWVIDEVTTGRVLTGVEFGFRDGFADLYPPVLYYLAAPATMAARMVGAPFGETPYLDPGDDLVQAFIRWVVLLTAAGAVAGLHTLVRQGASASASAMAVAAAFAGGTAAYSARAGNVEMPYLMFTLWSCAFLHGWFRTRRGSWLSAASICAAFAAATKDQAAGFFLLLPILLPLLSKWTHGGLRPFLRDRAIWRAGVAGVGTWAALLLIPLNSRGFWRHVVLLQEGQYPPFFPTDAAGLAGFFWLLAQLLVFVAGAPAVIAATSGWVFAVRQGSWPVLAATMVPICSYLLTFLLPIRYSYDRFMLGIWFLLAAGVAVLLDSLTGRARRVAQVAMVVVLIVNFAQATMIGVMQRTDSRHGIERFIAWTVPATTRVGGVGPPEYLPRLWRRVVLMQEFDLPNAPDVLVVNWDYASRFKNDALAALRRGELPHRPVYQCEAVRWPMVDVLPSLDHYGERGLTNLRKISPTISVYSRIPLAAFGAPEPGCHAATP